MKNTMSKQHFESEMSRAKTFQGLGTDIEYWAGYIRGLRRNFHGEAFGTEAEHRLWLEAVNSEDTIRRQLGQGYADGLKGRSKQEPGADHKQLGTGRRPKPKGSSAMERLDEARKNLDRQADELDS